MAPSTSPRRLRLAELQAKLLDIPYCPWDPQPVQQRFLLDFSREALYGGAVGGGKSVAILMAALQFVAIPGYAALILRRSYTDLSQSGGLMDLAQDWFGGQAKFDNQMHSWTFPGGGSIRFGYMQTKHDRYRYQGGQYHFVGFDELTQMQEADYRYLFSRMRRPSDPTNPLSRVPIRMRATSNPGGVGHEWVYRRFVKPWEAWKRGEAARPKRNFWPARLEDNPALDREEYLHTLEELDPITREQLLRGDWNIRPEGRLFRRDWFRPFTDAGLIPQLDRYPTVRYWDLAATDPDPTNDPDYTAGAKVTRLPDGRYVIRDMVHLRASPQKVETEIVRTAKRDGRRVLVYMEQEPGAAGKTVIAHYRRVLDGYAFRGDLPSGKKEVRAGPVASQAEGGNVLVLPGAWVGEFLDEIEIFPDGLHDDQVDALSGAMGVLAKSPAVTFAAGLNDDLQQENPWAM